MHYNPTIPDDASLNDQGMTYPEREDAGLLGFHVLFVYHRHVLSNLP